MFASKIRIIHPTQNLKRYLYVRQEFQECLREYSRNEHCLSDLWVFTAKTNPEDAVNILFGQGNVEITDRRELCRRRQSEMSRGCKGTDDISDVGYYSLGNDENTEDMKFRRADILVCVISPDTRKSSVELSSEDILLIGKLSSVEKKVILFVDTHKCGGRIEAGQVHQYLESLHDVPNERCLKMSAVESVELIGNTLEQNLVEEMQYFREQLTESYEDNEEGVYDLHNCSSTNTIRNLDRLITICKRPMMPVEVPEELRSFLTSKHLTGLRGFGVQHNKFVIHVHSGTSDVEKEQAYQEAVKYYKKDSIEIHENDDLEPQSLVPHSYGCGDKLIRENKQFGSIGFCCKMEKKDNTTKIVIITSSHVLYENEKVFMNVCDNLVEIGQCIYSPNGGALNLPSLVDIAVVEINQNNEKHFHTKILDTNNRAEEFQLFESICDQYTQVWKHGASTGLTTGIVTSPNFTMCCNGENRFVTIVEGQVFSEPGDSGACVLLQENAEIFALSVIVGESSLDKHPPEEGGKKRWLTARLASAIERFESEFNAKLHLRRSSD